MNYKVKFIAPFERDLKYLSKKYPSIKSDFSKLLLSLKSDPTQGVSLGNNCFKIRMAISSKAKGKSGGARVITCVRIVEDTVYLLSIFDKSEQESITNKELKELLSFIATM